ncbi:MAG: outer membrane beta-barrel protein [Bacteroidota bacterium]
MDEVINNSYTKSANQIFKDSKVIIEDDIDPNNLYRNKIKDVFVERYLKDLDIFYAKNQTATINFFDAEASAVQVKEYIYVEVYFKSLFTGLHNISSKEYKTAERVATIIASKNSDKWEMEIASVVFYNPKQHTFMKEPEVLVGETETPSSDTMVVATLVTTDYLNEEKESFQPVWQIAPFVSYGTNTNLGLGVKASWHFLENLGAQAGFNYFPSNKTLFDKDTVDQTGYELALNVMYYFNPQSKLQIYTLGGVNYMFVEATVELDNLSLLSQVFFGLNVGLGIDFNITKRLIPFIETKYLINEQILVGAGVRISLN